MASQQGYHHGDLRNALLEVTKQLLHERGSRGFSVAEAARRAGVSASAPYRHFPDRDAMLAAVGAMGFIELQHAFAALPLAAGFEDRMAQLASAYYSFSVGDPARFESMFANGLDKSAHPALLHEAAAVQGMLEDAMRPFVAESDVTARAAQLWSLAHGFAALSASRNLGHVVPIEHQLPLVASTARAWASGVERTRLARAAP